MGSLRARARLGAARTGPYGEEYVTGGSGFLSMILDGEGEEASPARGRLRTAGRYSEIRYRYF
jgi:hypothetical protein